MKRCTALVMPFFLAAVVVPGCGSDSPTRPRNGIIEMRADNFRFEPRRIALEVGESATLVIESVDQRYTFTIDELAIDQELPAGQTVRVDIRGSQEGGFTYYSAVEGHRERGMEGRLSVRRRPVVVGSGGGGGGTYSY